MSPCNVGTAKLGARALPKSKLLCLPRDTVEGMEELAVVREDLHYRKQLIRVATGSRIFPGKRAINLPHYHLCEDEQCRDRGMSVAVPR